MPKACRSCGWLLTAAALLVLAALCVAEDPHAANTAASTSVPAAPAESSQTSSRQAVSSNDKQQSTVAQDNADADYALLDNTVDASKPAAGQAKGSEASAAVDADSDAPDAGDEAPEAPQIKTGAASAGDEEENLDEPPEVATPQAANKAVAATLQQQQQPQKADNDVDPEGSCKEFIHRFCADVEAGQGHLADCLSQAHAAAESGDTSKDVPETGLSDECDEEVMQVKSKQDADVNQNPALAKACAEDINRFCNVSWFMGSSSGTVVGCLRDVKEELKPGCRKEVFKVQLDASYDYRADASLYEACKADAGSLCAGVKPGGGRIQACLRDQRMKLSWDCEAELFRKEVEDADDIRLSVRLFRACLADKKQLCADVPPGQAMAKQCLEEHRQSLSEKCRLEIDSMIARRVQDFRLDSRLRKACDASIADMCTYLGDMDIMDTYDAAVITCLQDFREEIRDEACQAQVHKYIELAAQDIRFDVPLADACYKDRMQLCANVPPGSARVIRCLQNHRDQLSSVCKSTLLSEEVRFSENIDFQYPMKQACTKEIGRFCKDVPHGNARVIRCLQDNKTHKDFGKACLSEVQHYEQESVRDYRLNHRLYSVCKQDVNKLCREACSMKEGELCGGKVLACLSEKQVEIKSGECNKEVAYLQKMGVQDFRADMQLAAACRTDVDAFCANVEPGEGRVHKCLRDHAAQISPLCRREELRLEEKEADNVNLSASLMRICSEERGVFCRGVQPGSARVFRCLAQNMGSADFGATCRNTLLQKLHRREANWRLDPPLRKACKADVDSLCAAEDAERSEDGAVKECLINNQASLNAGCRHELSRSLHMSFFIWQPNGLLTSACDADIQQHCLSGAKGSQVMPGAVGVCLAEIVDFMSSTDVSHERRRLLEADSSSKSAGRKEKRGSPGSGSSSSQAAAGQPLPSSDSTVRRVPKLSDKCYQLAVIAHPRPVSNGFDVQSSAYAVLESSLSRLESATGLQTFTRDKRGGVVAISITGWTALAGMVALVVVLMAAATWAVRYYTSGGRSHSGYTLVTKTVQ